MGDRSSISLTMKAAIACAKKNGGRLVREPGGHWMADGYDFGTTTIEALVTRDLAFYSEWFTNKKGRKFPIEATVR